jgi:hypothetical protein
MLVEIESDYIIESSGIVAIVTNGTDCDVKYLDSDGFATQTITGYTAAQVFSKIKAALGDN